MKFIYFIRRARRDVSFIDRKIYEVEYYWLFFSLARGEMLAQEYLNYTLLIKIFYLLYRFSR